MSPTKEVTKTVAPDWSWVQEGREKLAEEIHRQHMPEVENELAHAEERLKKMKPVEFVCGSTEHFHWEVAAKDDNVIIHFYPVELPAGFSEEFPEIVKQVYWELLKGKQDCLGIGFIEFATPSWVDPVKYKKEGKELPVYPSWCVTLAGYGPMTHVHQRLTGEAFALINKRLADRE